MTDVLAETPSGPLARAEELVTWAGLKQELQGLLATHLAWVDIDVEGGGRWPVQEWAGAASRCYIFEVVQAQSGGAVPRPADLPVCFRGVAEALLYMLPPHLRHDLLERPHDAEPEPAQLMWQRYLAFTQLLAPNAANWTLLQFDHALYGARRRDAGTLDYCQVALQFHLNRGRSRVLEAAVPPGLPALISW